MTDYSIDHKLDRILSELERMRRLIITGGTKVGKELDSLASQVEQSDSVEESAITLIEGLAQKITDAGTDPAKLTALTTELKTESDKLAAAVAANTPAAPADSSSGASSAGSGGSTDTSGSGTAATPSSGTPSP